MASTKSDKQDVTAQQTHLLMNRLLSNTISTRSKLFEQMIEPHKDINFECGYPEDISIERYKMMFDREGIASRVVTVWPNECWSQDPEIYENQDSEETEFELAWQSLEVRHNLFHFLHRADELSGIGRFGIILLGLDDGLDLNQPVEGIEPTGAKAGSLTSKSLRTRRLTYVRVFDESCVKVSSVENDIRSPRYGQPLQYDVDFGDILSQDASTSVRSKVHWTRVIHVADNRKNSEIYGTPRQQSVFNRLLDIRKLLGGSAEMFWKGAFPGYAFETQPDVELSPTDVTAMREEFAEFSTGLNRFLALSQMTAKSLAPQVESPEHHIEAQIKMLCASIKVPWRIFIGSEAAQLASEQDRRNFNTRIATRRTKYITPCLIRCFVDRLILLGILPMPVGDGSNQLNADDGLSPINSINSYAYTVDWPDLEVAEPKDKAEVAKILIEAISSYISSGANQIISEKMFLTRFLGMEETEADAILEEALRRVDELDDPTDMGDDRQTPTGPNAGDQFDQSDEGQGDVDASQ